MHSFWDNTISYRTESLRLFELMSSATKSDFRANCVSGVPGGKGVSATYLVPRVRVHVSGLSDMPVGSKRQ